jgi:hypothetical protein
MRKLIVLLSVTCVALFVSSAPANAGSVTIHEVTPHGTVDGTVCLIPCSVTFNGTITTPDAQIYSLAANGAAAGSWPNVTVSGHVTVSQGSTTVETVTVTGTGPNLIVAATDFLNKTITLVP